MMALVCSDCGEHSRKNNKCIKCGCEYLSYIDMNSDDPYKDIKNNTYPRLEKFRGKIIKSAFVTEDNQKLKFEDTEGWEYEIGIKNNSENSYIREIRGRLSSLIGEKILMIDRYEDNIYDFDANTVYTFILYGIARSVSIVFAQVNNDKYKNGDIVIKRSNKFNI